jgi:ankyrin repeat protein
MDQRDKGVLCHSDRRRTQHETEMKQPQPASAQSLLGIKSSKFEKIFQYTMQTGDAEKFIEVCKKKSDQRELWRKFITEAMRRKYWQSVRQLVDSGYVPVDMALDDNFSLLHFACKSDQVDVDFVEWLVRDYKVDANSRHIPMNSFLYEGFTAIHIASTIGNKSHLQVIRKLVEYGADVNVRDFRGATALHYVKNIETTQLLLSLRAHVNSRDIYGFSPLISIADRCVAGDIELLKFLLDRGADVNATDIPGRNVIAILLSNNATADSVLLLKFFELHGLKATSKNLDDLTALDIYNTISYKNLNRIDKDIFQLSTWRDMENIPEYLIPLLNETIDMLLQKRSKMQKKTELRSGYEQKDQIFINACECSTLERIQNLIKSVSKKETFIQGAISAAKAGNLINLKFLVNKGFVTLDDKLESSLIQAAIEPTYHQNIVWWIHDRHLRNSYFLSVNEFNSMTEDMRKVNFQKACGPFKLKVFREVFNLHTIRNFDQKTLNLGALNAARYGNYKVLQYMIGQKLVEPLLVIEEGENLLHVACNAEVVNYSLIQWLVIQLKIDLNARHSANQGNTALHYLTMYNTETHLNALNLLLRYGADPNIQNDLGQTPLHLLNGSQMFMKTAYLVNMGAKINIKDNQGITPLQRLFDQMQFATNKEYLSAMKYLLAVCTGSL